MSHSNRSNQLHRYSGDQLELVSYDKTFPLVSGPDKNECLLPGSLLLLRHGLSPRPFVQDKGAPTLLLCSAGHSSTDHNFGFAPPSPSGLSDLVQQASMTLR